MKKIFQCSACFTLILFDEMYETPDHFMLIDYDKIFQGCIPKWNNKNPMCLKCVQTSEVRSRFFNDEKF